MKFLLSILCLFVLQSNAQKSIWLKTDVIPTGKNKHMALVGGGGSIVMPYNRGIVTITHIIPVVNAGNMTSLQYTSSAVSTTLTGTAVDATTTQWQQVSGPNSATIGSAGNLNSSFSNLIPGLYRFRLKGTSSTGDISYDTTYVSILKKITYTAAGLTRTALVHIPPTGTVNPPIYFGFHGHKSTSLSFADKRFEVYWDSCLIIYPQGVPTPSPTDKTGQFTGWQRTLNYTNPNYPDTIDIDIAFYDVMRTDMINTYGGDANKIFVHGWSNGGEFVYDALRLARGSQIKGGCAAASLINGSSGQPVVPWMHVAGTNDDKISFSTQQGNIPIIRGLNSCTTSNSVYIVGDNGLLGTQYVCTTPFVFLQYDGPHDYPDKTIPPIIIKFIRETAGL